MASTIRVHDLEAQISFLTTEEGGRIGPAQSGYRPDHNFGLPGTLNAAAHEYIGQALASPGETVRAKVWLAIPELQASRLFEGFRFTVQEGNHIVGNGIITKVLNASLSADA